MWVLCSPGVRLWFLISVCVAAGLSWCAPVGPQYFDVMEEIQEAAEVKYRELTDDTEGFYDYFYDATVVNEIALMNIGSRPSRRKAAVRDKSSLRAIPWVFGWSQVSPGSLSLAWLRLALPLGCPCVPLPRSLLRGLSLSEPSLGSWVAQTSLALPVM